MSKAAISDTTWAECLDLLDEALSDLTLPPDHRARLCEWRVRVLGFELNRVPDAIDAAQAAVTEFPQNRSLRLQLARLAGIAGQDFLAFRMYKKVWRANKSSQECAIGLFKSLVRRGRLSAALEFAQAIPKKNLRDAASNIRDVALQNIRGAATKGVRQAAAQNIREAASRGIREVASKSIRHAAFKAAVQDIRERYPHIFEQTVALARDWGDERPESLSLYPALARLARQSERDLLAFRLYKAVWRTDPSADDAPFRLFEILMQRGRVAAARKLVPSVPAARASHLAQKFLTQIALLDHDPDRADEAIAAAAANPRSGTFAELGKISQSLRLELSAGETMTGIRHVVIAGVSYVGSTVLNVVLGSAPGFGSAGETHWLTSSIRAGRAKDDWRRFCRICGEGCEAFTPEFRNALAADPSGWFGQIARQLHVRNVVTSDKNLFNIWSLDPLFRFDLIVLYKTPIQQAQSLLKEAIRDHGSQGPGVLRHSIDSALDRWASSYLGHLKLLQPKGRRIVVNWEEFVRDPSFHLRRIGRILQIPISPRQHKEIRLQHFMGGNQEVDLAKVAALGQVTLRPSNAPSLPDDIAARVNAHRDARYIDRLLTNAYRQQFQRGVLDRLANWRRPHKSRTVK